MWASLVVAIMLCLGQSAEAAHAADAAYAALPPAEAATILREVRQADAALHGELAAEFVAVVNRNVLGPDAGPHTKTLRFNSTGAQQALTVEDAFARDPEYRPPTGNGASGGDYHADGHLIVWRPLRRWCFRSAELNRMVGEREALLIDPAGQILRRTQGRHLEGLRSRFAQRLLRTAPVLGGAGSRNRRSTPGQRQTSDLPVTDPPRRPFIRFLLGRADAPPPRFPRAA